MELKAYTWYYGAEGRVWVVLAVLTKDPTNRKVWLLEQGKTEPTEHDFSLVEDLVVSGKIKPYIK